MNTAVESQKLSFSLARNFNELLSLPPEGGPYSAEMAATLLADAWRERASDIHIQPLRSATRVRFRIDGVLYEVAQLSDHHGRCLLNQFKVLGDLDPIARFTPRDTRATADLGAVRLNLRLAMAPSQFGEAMTIRLLDSKRLERSIQDLGLSTEMLHEIEEWLDSMSGMFLAAGPTGCGKTTSIYALLHELRYSEKAIISIEDPVEYQVEGITQISVDEVHELNFQEAVKALLRLDPDFLMLGEIRDKPSALSAINASLSGRILLSTVHSRDAAGVLSAFRNWQVADAEIAECLSMVLAQRLVRELCAKCRRPSELTSTDKEWFNRRDLVAPSKCWTAPGCNECKGLGFYGRVGIFELWRVNDEDYRLILAHEDEHSLRARLQRRSHGFMMVDAVDKIERGLTTVGELNRIGGL